MKLIDDAFFELVRELVAAGATPLEAAAEAGRQKRAVLSKLVETERHYFCAIESGDEQVGRIWFGPLPASPLDFYIYNLEVFDRNRGEGIGRSTITHVLEEAGRLGATRVGLQVFESNSTALHLYESMGFRVEAMGSDSREMWCQLGD